MVTLIETSLVLCRLSRKSVKLGLPIKSIRSEPSLTHCMTSSFTKVDVKNAAYREIDWDKFLNTKMVSRSRDESMTLLQAEWSHEESVKSEKLKQIQDGVVCEV